MEAELGEAEALAALGGALGGGAGGAGAGDGALRGCEGRAGFLAALCGVLAGRGGAGAGAPGVRALAAVCLKNGVARGWRAAGAAERARVRGALLVLLPDEDPVVAEHVALAAAKVARFDFPREWPDVFERVLGGLQAAAGSPAEAQYLLCLNHLLKELASKRLASDKQQFRAVAGGLLQPVLGMWKRAHEAACGRGGAPPEPGWSARCCSRSACGACWFTASRPTRELWRCYRLIQAFSFWRCSLLALWGSPCRPRCQGPSRRRGRRRRSS